MDSTAITLQRKVRNRSIISLIIALLVLGVGMWFWSYLHNPRQFPVATVKIMGDYEHASKEKIQQIISPLVQQSLFSVNIKAIKAQLLALPWIQSVEVKRLWPDELMIKLTEKLPVARWNQNSLMTAASVVFQPQPNTFPTNLPSFIGPSGKQALMLRTYQQISDLIAPLDLHIVQLRLTSDMLWRMQLNNGMDVMIGGQDVLTRVQRFVKVYDQVFADKRQAKYVDLRYANGLAVKWDDSTRDKHG